MAQESSLAEAGGDSAGSLGGGHRTCKGSSRCSVQLQTLLGHGRMIRAGSEKDMLSREIISKARKPLMGPSG